MIDMLRAIPYPSSMSDTDSSTVLPDVGIEDEVDSKEQGESGYLVICWDDPVNLMEYVTRVFQVVFRWSKEKAERHMLQVHREGRSVLARESLEKAEHYVHQLQAYSLHATLEREDGGS